MSNAPREFCRLDFERKMLPESMRRTLVQASTLLTGWELIRSDVITAVRDFFRMGWADDPEGIDPRYHSDVESRVVKGSASIFDASVQWLVEMEALTVDDVEVLDRIRKHRHEVAHELATYLVDPALDVRIDVLVEARDVLVRLGQFWGRITVDTDPQFDGQVVLPEDIRSGTSLLFDSVLALALGDN